MSSRAVKTHLRKHETILRRLRGGKSDRWMRLTMRAMRRGERMDRR